MQATMASMQASMQAIVSWVLDKTASVVVVPSGVTTIPVDALKESDSLTSVTISATVNVIEKRAFAQCPVLAAVSFEDGSVLATIGEYAFYQSPRCLKSASCRRCRRLGSRLSPCAPRSPL